MFQRDIDAIEGFDITNTATLGRQRGVKEASKQCQAVDEAYQRTPGTPPPAQVRRDCWRAPRQSFIEYGSAVADAAIGRHLGADDGFLSVEWGFGRNVLSIAVMTEAALGEMLTMVAH